MLLPNRVRKIENYIKSSLGLEAWNNKLHDYKSQMSYYWYFFKNNRTYTKTENMAMSQSGKLTKTILQKMLQNGASLSVP